MESSTRDTGRLHNLVLTLFPPHHHHPRRRVSCPQGQLVARDRDLRHGPIQDRGRVRLRRDARSAEQLNPQRHRQPVIFIVSLAVYPALI